MTLLTTYSGQVLLFINLLYCVLEPNINLAHALPSIPLALLAGFQLYLKHNTQPDYKKEYEEKLLMYQNQFIKQVAERDEFYTSEIKTIKEEQSRLNISTIKPMNQAKTNFRF